MYDDIATLVKIEKTINEYGDVEERRTERDVFVGFKSVGYNEFYQANSVGMKPEIKLVLPDYLDYDDEEIVIYHKKEYKVIRTYRTKDELEIVLQRGVN